MQYEEWEAKVVERPDLLKSVVYMVRRLRDGGREYLLADGSMVAYELGAVPSEDPFFAKFDRSQIQALAAAFEGAGYKTPDTHLVEGKLGATERHLEDMRKLVFSPRSKR